MSKTQTSYIEKSETHIITTCHCSGMVEKIKVRPVGIKGNMLARTNEYYNHSFASVVK